MTKASGATGIMENASILVSKLLKNTLSTTCCKMFGCPNTTTNARIALVCLTPMNFIKRRLQEIAGGKLKDYLPKSDLRKAAKADRPVHLKVFTKRGAVH